MESSSTGGPCRNGGTLGDFTANSESTRGPAAELWRRTLSQIPTQFGRLVYLASLRDGATGRYAHPALSHLMDAEDADRMLCHSHHQVFSGWLRFSLEEQKMDLEEYLRAGGGPAHAPHYGDLVPRTARSVERELYLTDLETLLELLKFENGGAFSIPEA